MSVLELSTSAQDGVEHVVMVYIIMLRTNDVKWKIKTITQLAHAWHAVAAVVNSNYWGSASIMGQGSCV